MSPFERNKLIKTAEDVKRLADRLSECPEVTRYGDIEHNEAWALASSFADLEDSFRALLDEQIPKLLATDTGPSELYDTLLDVGEEFRHILYHVLQQQKFYRYLTPDCTEFEGPRNKSAG